MPSTLNCPTCRSPTDAHMAGGAPAHVCEQCRSVWAEKGVLASLLGTESDLRSTYSDPESTDLRCPADGTPLVRVPYARLDPDVTVATCETCNGILVDAAQIPRLEALNERILQLFGDGTFTARGRRRPARLRRLLVRLLQG